MGFFTFTKHGRKLVLLAFLLMGAIYLGGCDVDVGGLVCGNGEVWSTSSISGRLSGLIFCSNGDWYTARYGDIEKYWTCDRMGTYTISGDKITYHWNYGGKGTFAFSINGDTLTLSSHSGEYYTKSRGVYGYGCPGH